MLHGYPALTSRMYSWTKYNFYARDEWRVSRKLTLNLGVHYEVNTPPRERNNYWANFDVSTGNLLIAGKNASSTGNVATDFSSVGPRAGFAWQMSEKTVLRSGYGIFFDPQTSGTNLRQFVQVPFSFTISINPGSLFPQNRVAAGLPTPADSPAINPDKPFGVLKGTAFDYRNLSTQQFNFGVQRQITATSSVAPYDVNKRTTWFSLSGPPRETEHGDTVQLVSGDLVRDQFLGSGRRLADGAAHALEYEQVVRPPEGSPRPGTSSRAAYPNLGITQRTPVSLPAAGCTLGFFLVRALSKP